MHNIARSVVSAVLAVVALSGAAVARPHQSGEERLAHMLDGRIAGKPIDCLTQMETRDVEVIDGTALVYGSGRTIWVNRTSNPHDLDSDDVLVTRLHTSQLCRNEVIRLHDSSSHMYHGFVTLEDFVPYSRAPAAAH